MEWLRVFDEFAAAISFDSGCFAVDKADVDAAAEVLILRLATIAQALLCLRIVQYAFMGFL